MATDAQKVAVAQNFLLAAPPGEFNEVVTDVRALVGDDSLLNQTALATFKTYNESQMIAAKAPGGSHKFLVTPAGAVDTKLYKDPRGGKIIKFDHVKQVAVEVDSDLAPGPNETFRAALDAAVQAYVEEFYPTGTCAVYEDGSNMIVAISAAKFNAKNFWNARVRSVWEIASAAKGTASLKGTLKNAVHIYEDGNVQLATSYSASTTAPGGDASAIVAAIKEAETTYQGNLASNQHELEESTFKNLRRRLPVTAERLDFDKILNNSRVNSEMHKK